MKNIDFTKSTYYLKFFLKFQTQGFSKIVVQQSFQSPTRSQKLKLM